MQIISGVMKKATKAVLYGPEGIGKTTFASKAPEPLFIDTEGSTTRLNVRRLPAPESFAMILEQVQWVLQNRNVCKTLVLDTADWAQQRCADAVCAKYQKGHSPKYIKNAWMFAAASIAESGAKRPEVTLYAPESNERAYLTHEEIDRFVEAVKGQPVEIPALLCLSSLRRSEMLALDWKNVDLKNKVLYVKGATVRGKDGLVDKPQNKSKKSRRAVPIIPPLMEALLAVDDKTGRVVKMGADTALKQVKKVCQDTGITVVDLHGLRHSFASLAYHLEIPEMIAAEIGGWEDLGTMHNIYTHIAKSDIAKRSQDLQNYFNKQNCNENCNESEKVT